MKPVKRPFLAAVTAAFALSCLLGSNQPVHAQLAVHHAHHRAQQGVIGLDVYRDGTVIHLLAGEQKGEEMSLWHRRSDDAGGTWSAPVRVDGPGARPRPARRGDEAQIAARGDTLLAIWSVTGSGWGGSGPLASAISHDGGRTWLPGARPSDSGLTKGEGFADLAVDQEAFHAVWLDSRDGKHGLRYTASPDGTAWSANATVAAPTCICCWNTLLAREGMLRVLFRGDDPRDMELASRSKQAWKTGGTVGEFGWHIKGCPEAGGGLAETADEALHALVWTGLEGRTGLYVVHSRGSAGWMTPRRIGGKDAQHGDLAANALRLAAVWDEKGAILAAFSADSGKSWGAPVRLTSDVGALNPRVVAAGEGFLVLWTQKGADGANGLGMRRMN